MSIIKLHLYVFMTNTQSETLVHERNISLALSCRNIHVQKCDYYNVPFGRFKNDIMRLQVECLE